MDQSSRARANRRNAKLSTGPRSKAGKARAARNALRHGLSIPVLRDPSSAATVERLARLIAGNGADPQRFELAQRIAEAQVDLDRVRRARLVLLKNCELPTADASSELWRIDRYERRALSRRKNAIRALDHLG